MWWAETLIAHYKSLRIDPKTKSAVFSDGLNFETAIDLFRAIHTSPWEEEISFTPHFTLCKVQADVNEWTTQRSYSPFSIIYFNLLGVVRGIVYNAPH